MFIKRKNGKLKEKHGIPGFMSTAFREQSFSEDEEFLRFSYM